MNNIKVTDTNINNEIKNNPTNIINVLKCAKPRKRKVDSFSDSNKEKKKNKSRSFKGKKNILNMNDCLKMLYIKTFIFNN